MSETKPKKMVSRNAAIGFGIICIILIGSVAALLVVINEKDNTIQTNNNQINSLNLQVDSLTGIVNFRGDKWEWLLIQNESVQAGQSLDVYDLTAANYSGFVTVEMDGVNLTSTWIRVAWGVGPSPFYYSPSMVYNETRSVHGILAYSGDYFDYEYFPILKDGYCHVTLGNNGNQTITELMRISYHY